MSECASPTIEAINLSLNLELWKGLETGPALLALAQGAPLADLALRVWYHQANGQSRFCPRQSRYLGPRPGGPHQGVDLFCAQQTPLRAVATGTLQYNVANDPKGWGNHAYLYFVRERQRYICVYAHLHAASAFVGSRPVSENGSTPLLSGCTGNAGDGTCDRTHRCTVAGRTITPIADHVHIELLKISADGKVEGRLDPVAFFGWSVSYISDERCDYCLEATQHA